jgi:hypothetical protein
VGVKAGDAVIVDINRHYRWETSPYQGHKGIIIYMAELGLSNNASVQLIGFNRLLGFERRCLTLITDDREAALIQAQLAFGL